MSLKSDIGKISIAVLLTGGVSYGTFKALEPPKPSGEPLGNNLTELPKPPDPFKGEINLTWSDSKPDFPKQVKAPKGAPNVLIIMTDDVGASASSTFGGPINTPTMDELARGGIRYNQFHTTALSSPTRAALLTGRNHHVAHTGNIMEAGCGYPGYDTLMGEDTATIGHVLRYNGYSTAWFGKNHNVPDFETDLRMGPFERWPNNLGFERFYGFIGGEANQYVPSMYDNFTPVDPYIGNKNYTMNEDLANQAIRWIKEQKSISPDKPFFSYYVTGGTHAPHQVPKEWSDKYKGKFDKGWDVQREETLKRQKEMGLLPKDTALTPRPKDIPAWDTLSATEKKNYARMMEIYAGFLEQTDHYIGTVINAVKEIGEFDNTLIIYIQGDNGASGEGAITGSLNENVFFNIDSETPEEIAKGVDKLGTVDSYGHYPAGWALAMTTPFQWMKQVASHYGGTRNGMVISWPKGIKERGGLRTQWHHVVDIAPTVYEAVKVAMPNKFRGVEQKPLEGVSMMYTFNNPNAKTTHQTQYFEIVGYHGIYHNGWVAAKTPASPPWMIGKFNGPNTTDEWELYNVEKDFSQAHNIAKENPKKLEEMKQLFFIEAGKNNVFPMFVNDLNNPPALISNRIDPNDGRTLFTYWTELSRVPEANAPDFKNKSFTIEADITFEKGTTPNGMILTMGGRFAGFGLWIENGKLVFGYANPKSEDYQEVISTSTISDGNHKVKFEFRSDFAKTKKFGAGGEASILVDGKKIASGKINKTIPFRFMLTEYMDIGQDYGTTISPRYEVPFKLNGKVNKVLVDTDPKI